MLVYKVLFMYVELCWKLRVSYMRECQKMEIMQKTRTVSSVPFCACKQGCIP